MGWMRTLLLGDIGNRLDIADTERDIGRLRHTIRRKRGRDSSQDKAIAQLEKESDDLKMCVASLARALQAKGVLSHEEIVTIVDKIDDDE